MVYLVASQLHGRGRLRRGRGQALLHVRQPLPQLIALDLLPRRLRLQLLHGLVAVPDGLLHLGIEALQGGDSIEHFLA